MVAPFGVVALLLVAYLLSVLSVVQETVGQALRDQGNVGNLETKWCREPFFVSGVFSLYLAARCRGASWVAMIKGKVVASQSIGTGPYAEVYDSELIGLAWAARNVQRLRAAHPSIRHIHFFADNSSTVESIIRPKCRPGQKHATVFFNIATKLLEEDEETSMEIAWAPGHQDIPGNEKADALAKEACTMHHLGQRTYANARRRMREQVQGKWVQEWEKTNPTGCFGLANRLEPKLRPTQRFKETPHEVFGRLTQCRTGHAHIGEYYELFNIPEATDCECGEQLQTREHIIRTCPRYSDHRPILREGSQNLVMCDLLGTTEGIEAVARFLAESGAFTKTGNPRREVGMPLWEEEPEPHEQEEDG